MALPNSNPSANTATNPYFQDNNFAKGVEMRNNNIAVWGNFDYLNWNILTPKTTITGADLFGLADSVASFVYKPISWTNMLAQMVTDLFATFSPKGAVRNYVYTSSSASDSTASIIPLDNTIPQSGEGKNITALNTTITPTKSANVLRIQVVLFLSQNAAGGYNATSTVFRDAGANALSTCVTENDDTTSNWVHVHDFEVAAGSTSATTFKVNYGGNGDTVYLNNSNGSATFGGTLNSFIRVTEVQA